jgi:hypothetical protein
LRVISSEKPVPTFRDHALVRLQTPVYRLPGGPQRLQAPAVPRDRTCRQCRIVRRERGTGALPARISKRRLPRFEVVAEALAICLKKQAFPAAPAVNWSRLGQFFSSIINSTSRSFGDHAWDWGFLNSRPAWKRER